MDEAVLEFVARLDDQASAAARALRGDLDTLGGPIDPITGEVRLDVDVDDLERDLDSIPSRFGDAGDDAGDAFYRELEDVVDRMPDGFDEAGDDAGEKFRDAARKHTRKVPDDADKAGRESGSAFGAGFKGALGAVGGLIAFDAVAGGVWDTVDAASDLAETTNKSTVIFGDNMRQVQAWASTSATSVGLSEAAALEAAAGYGNMLSQLGYTGDAAAATATEVVQLAADLGSFNNLDTADVNDRISAALRGEYDSLQALIPNINAARVEQEALAMSGKDSASELTAAEKAAATLAIIERDGAAASGDFAETIDGVANSQKVAAAQAADLKATIGDALLPIVQRTFGFLSSTVIPAVSTFVGEMRSGEGVGGRVADVLSRVGDVAKGAAGFLSQNRGAVIAVTAAMGALLLVTQAHAAVMAVQSAGGIIAFVKGLSLVQSVTRVAAAVQWLWNAALSANPIGLVVLAIAALVAGLVWFFTKTETGRKVWEAVMTAIRTAAQAVASWFTDTLVPWLKGAWDKIVAAVTWVWTMYRSYLNLILKIVMTVFNAIRRVVTNVVTTVRNVIARVFSGIRDFIAMIVYRWKALITESVRRILAVIEWFKRLPGKVREWFTKVREGAVEKMQALLTWVRELPGKIIEKIGNAGRMLLDVGKDVIRGLWDGLKSMRQWIIDKVVGFVGDILPGPIKDVLGIASPSRVAAGLGRWFGIGLADGIADERDTVAHEAAALATAAEAELRNLNGRASAGVPNVVTLTGATRAVQLYTIRHEVVSPDGTVSELDARTIATMLAADPTAAEVVERGLRRARATRAARTLTAANGTTA